MNIIPNNHLQAISFLQHVQYMYRYKNFTFCKKMTQRKPCRSCLCYVTEKCKYSYIYLYILQFFHLVQTESSLHHQVTKNIVTMNERTLILQVYNTILLQYHLNNNIQCFYNPRYSHQGYKINALNYILSCNTKLFTLCIL